MRIEKRQWTVDSYTLEILIDLTQYKEQQPVELDSNDPALDKLTKDIQTRVLTEIPYLNTKHTQSTKKLCFYIILRSNFLKLQELQKCLE
jgi:hypothetical protein